MRLREDTKIREKVTVHLGTWQIVSILLLSVFFSGLVFGLGIFVGKQGQGGMTTLQPAAGSVPQKAALKKGGLSVPQFPTLPGQVLSKFSPAEMLDSLSRFVVQSHVDTLVADEERFRQEEELIAAKARHRIRPDMYEAPVDPDPNSELPIDMAKERLAVTDAEKKEPAARPMGAPLPNKESLPKAAPRPAEVKAEAPLEQAASAKEENKGRPSKANVAAKEDGAVDADGKVQAGSKKTEKDSAQKAKSSENPIRVYSVQLLAYKDKSMALDYVKRLASSPLCAKYKPFIMPVEVPEKGQFYRVRIGRFTSKKEAERLRIRIAGQEGIDAKVVSM